ncbi:MAG: NADPH-dependent F420 reductase [Bacteroidales bacterium]|nr:NADPH-dependent F420 reductase [Bacteroidales bacterium]
MNYLAKDKKIAIIGGTGKEGKGLAYQWVKSGYHVIIGSRNEEKAQKAVDDLRNLIDKDFSNLEGMENTEAAKSADIIVLTVPYSAHKPTLNTLKPFLKGKPVVDVTVPLKPPKVTKVQMPPEGSALMEAKAILGDEAVLAGAFHNISYEVLLENTQGSCDVLVVGETKDIRALTLEMVAATGLKGWDAGPIENAVVLEGLTSILIGINKKHGVHSAGIQITGIEEVD